MERAFCCGLAVAAVVDLLLSLSVRRTGNRKLVSVLVLTRNSANIVEGVVRLLLMKEIFTYGRCQILASDEGSSDDTGIILELLERDGLVLRLETAGPECVPDEVLDLRDGWGEEKAHA